MTCKIQKCSIRDQVVPNEKQMQTHNFDNISARLHLKTKEDVQLIKSEKITHLFYNPYKTSSLQLNHLYKHLFIYVEKDQSKDKYVFNMLIKMNMINLFLINIQIKQHWKGIQQGFKSATIKNAPRIYKLYFYFQCI